MKIMDMEEAKEKTLEIEKDADKMPEEEEPKLATGRIQPWTRQITVRGVLVSTIIGAIYSVITMKLSLTTGIVPHLNVSVALLSFAFLRSWTTLLQKAGFVTKPFTKQENTMIQTCAVACYSLAVGGGFSSYLLALTKKMYELSGVKTEGNSLNAVKDPGYGWMTGYMFLVCFAGLFVLIPLRKILIIDLKLTFPTGLATAVLINGFHGRDDSGAKKQVGGFMKYFSVSILWAFFKWFFMGKAGNCGFSQFPTFGLQAWKQTFFFDFSATYVGAGMIVPHLVNLSLLLGAVLSYGIMWPLFSRLKGHWYPADLDETSMKSLYGYKVFLAIALILGDGLYNFVKIITCTIINVQARAKARNLRRDTVDASNSQPLEDLKKDEVFIREKIPMWIGVAGYIILSIISTILIPTLLFPQLKWYYVLIAYIIAPSLAFCNAYGAGLTDLNMSYNYGKIALFIIAALSGKDNGVVAALAGCGLVKSVINVACNLMQDFKTGHLTSASPRAMFLSQIVGTLIGCVMAPLSFFLFYKAFDVGNPKGELKAPFGLIYRNMAILGVEGFSVLPRHCLQLSYGFFAFAVLINIVRDISPSKIAKWMPLPMVVAAPFLVGAYFSIDMFIGSLIVFFWHIVNAKEADLMVPAVASGLICGEGLWTLPAAVLALAKVNPPICMKFVTS